MTVTLYPPLRLKLTSKPSLKMRFLPALAGQQLITYVADLVAQNLPQNQLVPNTRQIIAGDGLAGGGDLSADRTISVGAGAGITVNPDAIQLAAIADQRLLANISGGSAVPTAQSLSAILDNAIGSAQGSLAVRTLSGWTALGPGASGQFLKSQGAGADLTYATIAGGGDMLAANNLSDLANIVTARTNLELSTTEISVASAATTDIGGQNGLKILITGTTTITSLGTAINKLRFVRFAGALTLTHNATSLILPGGQNILTSAGLNLIFMSDGSGNWRCISAPINRVVRQVFTSGGTYTPTVGMLYADIECVGGGGGGGGAAGAASFNLIGNGGSSGGYSRKRATAAEIGASQTVTVGAAGTGGSAGANAGGAGGDTSVGTLCVGKGGPGGAGVSSGTAGGVPTAAAAGTGDFTPVGNAGGRSLYFGSATLIVADAGAGGPSVFGGRVGAQGASSGVNAGVAGGNYGAGGSGGSAQNTTSNAAGGAGSAGVIIITEYCH